VPQELQLFLEAWGIVTTIALPLALAAWLAGGRGRLCPRWRLMPFRGTLLDFVFLYFVYHTAAGLGASAAMDAGVVGARASLVGSVVALPVVLAAAAVLWRLVHEQPVRFRRPRPRDVALGVVAGVVLTPLTHAVYAATVFVNARLGLPESPHPLAELGVGESPAAIALFFGSVCLVVPWLEEFLFRGIVLRWAARSRVGAALTFGLAWLFAAGFARPGNPAFAVAFVSCLAVLAAGVEILGTYRPRTPTHTLRAIVTSSALFAAAHSAVWPSPVPLFVLACGLAYLTLRTGRITAAVVAHGTFNAVSTVILVLKPG
jgi:membrane protease YdiL (CAAX protease family)